MTFENLIFDARSIVTVASLLSFLGIVWWAYSGRRKTEFAEAAQLPFADEFIDETNFRGIPESDGEKRHG